MQLLMQMFLYHCELTPMTVDYTISVDCTADWQWVVTHLRHFPRSDLLNIASTRPERIGDASVIFYATTWRPGLCFVLFMLLISCRFAWCPEFLGRILRVDLIKWVSNVRPSVGTYVRPQKVSSISMKFDM